jgi:hypothetical protein
MGAQLDRAGCRRTDVLEGRRYSGIPDPPASPADHAIELARAVDNDMDAATPLDAQTAPTGIWKSRNEREIPTAPTSINLFLIRGKNEDQNHSDQLSTESGHPHDRAGEA